MTSDLHDATRQLIQDVESKDRKFRVAQIIFNLLVLILLIIAMIYGYNSLKKDQVSRDKAVQTIIQELDNRVNDQSKELQCIVDFFSQPDRNNLIITNPDKCFTKKLYTASDQPTVEPSSPAPLNNQNQTGTIPPAPTNTNTTSGQGNQSKILQTMFCTIKLKVLGCKSNG